MIEIKHTDDKGLISDFGFEPESGSLFMAAKDGNIVLGLGEIKLCGIYAILKSIKMSDEIGLFGFKSAIAKSLLNLADLRGVRFIFSNSDEERLLLSLRFKKCAEVDFSEKKYDENIVKKSADYKNFLDLDGYFNAHCV